MQQKKKLHIYTICNTFAILYRRPGPSIPDRETASTSGCNPAAGISKARMAESVDALVSNTNVREDVPVRPRLRVPNKMQVLDFQTLAFFFFLFAPRLHHRMAKSIF